MRNTKKTAKKKPKTKSKKTKKVLERKADDLWINLPEIPDLPKPKVDSEK